MGTGITVYTCIINHLLRTPIKQPQYNGKQGFLFLWLNWTPVFLLHVISFCRDVLAAVDSVAGEEGARIAEETQLDNPDNWWQLWRKISDEYQLKDQTILYCILLWCLEERHATARQWLYRFPGGIFSVCTAAIEVEQSTPAFKTARTLAQMPSKKRLIEGHITWYPVQ